MEYNYDSNSKITCWYKKVCEQKHCGAEDFCIRHRKMDYLVTMSTLTGKMRYSIPLYPDTEDKDAFMRLKTIQASIKDFVFDGKNLLIYSRNCGNGKTEWAKKLLLSWFGSIWHTTNLECRGLFVSMPKFISALKENMNKPNEYYQYVSEHILDADLVVWDEINYKDLSPYETEQLFNIISQRVAIGKSNIYTTNYDLPAIEKKLGNALSSRIIGASELVEIKGLDKRGVANG